MADPVHGRVLLVDEVRELVDLIGIALKNAGYSVSTADGPGSAARVLRDDRPDLVIVDMNVGRWSGLDVLRRIRSRSSVPVIMLVRGDSNDERAVARAMGADDCLEKPLDVRQLLSSADRWLTRVRSETAMTTTNLRVGSLRLDQERRTITKDSEVLPLSPPEYGVLRYLMAHAGERVPAAVVARHVWGPGGASGSTLLRTTLEQLRRKLEPDPLRPEFLSETDEGISLAAVPADS